VKNLLAFNQIDEVGLMKFVAMSQVIP
jgi:RNA recognition motif-containing protein